MASVQRRGVLRAAYSCSMISEHVIMVVAGIIRIDLLTCKSRFKKGQQRVDKDTAQKKARACIMKEWQNRWVNNGRGRWIVSYKADNRMVYPSAWLGSIFI